MGQNRVNPKVSELEIDLSQIISTWSYITNGTHFALGACEKKTRKWWKMIKKKPCNWLHLCFIAVGVASLYLPLSMTSFDSSSFFAIIDYCSWRRMEKGSEIYQREGVGKITNSKRQMVREATRNSAKHKHWCQNIYRANSRIIECWYHKYFGLW